MRYRTIGVVIGFACSSLAASPASAHRPTHAAAGGFLPADVDFMNVEIGQFLDIVTQRGEALR